MAALIIAIGIYNYSNQPSLFIPPSGVDKRTLEDAISNSSDLAAVKSACAIFAKCRDQYSHYQEEFTEHLGDLIIGVIVSFLFLFGSFSYGYFTIYRKAKTLRDENENAL